MTDTGAEGMDTDDWLDFILERKAQDNQAARQAAVTTEGMGTDEWLDEMLAEKAAAQQARRPQVIDSGPRVALAVDDPRVEKWIAAKLEAKLVEVAGASKGTRNDTLNGSAYDLGHYIPRYLAHDRVARKLLVAALAAGLPDDEARRTIDSGLEAGMREPRHPELPDRPSLEQLGGITATSPIAGAAGRRASTWSSRREEQVDFWQARPVLTHLHTFARARRVGPWAVLGAVLARVVTATPVDIVLPPLVGSEGSLNLYVASVGPSGAGKGAGEAAAADALVGLGQLEVATVGSGEGVAHLFAHRDKGLVVRDRNAVLFTVPEVDNLTALGNRQGATLVPQLRSAWSGEQLGFSYADPAKRLPIARHSYRLALVLGVQPGRAAPLLDDVDGGTPQRFVWLPTTDPDAPDEAPPCPPPWTWSGVPRRTASDQRGLTPMDIVHVAREAIQTAAVARLREEGDPLDGHRLLCRLKVAAALGLLDGRLDVTEQDWQLAGQVMQVSDATRAGVVAFLAERSRTANEQRGASEGVRAVVVAEKLEEAKVRRVWRSVLRFLARQGDWTASAELRRGISGVNREAFPEAVERLVATGQVELNEDSGRARYRLTTGAAR